ncbi:MAG TPA: hypothetical protein VFL13_07385 [Candidatus Baltobacteraceae bacterium]|nr:hypothetical protein [Candidatus Baltobacteraceae bacterium]
MNAFDGAVRGVLAGAAGTAMLNAVTYADMTIRDRPASELPGKMVDKLAQELHAPKPAGNRRQGLGAMLGYLDGFGSGVLYGMLRPRMRAVPWSVAAVALAAFTMAASEGSAAAIKQTDPKQWSAADWIADIVPRLVYGAVTAYAFDILARE